MSAFRLDSRLENDSLEISAWDRCLVRLMNDSRFPWLLLVPALPGLKDLHDIPVDKRNDIYREIDLASRTLAQVTNAAKMNVASLGNMVPQLHIHVIARFEGDEAWPGPVWGVGTPEPYADQDARSLIDKLKHAWNGEST